MKEQIIEVDEKCNESKDGKHEANWNTVTTDNDGGTVYIDVCCIHCGQSGCIGNDKALQEMISW